LKYLIDDYRPHKKFYGEPTTPLINPFSNSGAPFIFRISRRASSSVRPIRFPPRLSLFFEKTALLLLSPPLLFSLTFVFRNMKLRSSMLSRSIYILLSVSFVVCFGVFTISPPEANTPSSKNHLSLVSSFPSRGSSRRKKFFGIPLTTYPLPLSHRLPSPAGSLSVPAQG